MPHARVEALIFAAEYDINLSRDYVADLGLVRTPKRTELTYALQKIVTIAKAYGIQAIDLVCVDYKSDEILIYECIEGRQWGFTGKQAIHPRQVDIIQRHFMPSDEEISKALGIVHGCKVHEDRGVGAFELDGKMVDAPVVKWARSILSRALIKV